MRVVFALVVLLLGVSLLAQNLPPIQIETYGVPHLQEALVNAEARYQAGGPGVTEEELVTFHNHLVDILKLPDYAKVDHTQLRYLRMVDFKLGVLGSYVPKPGEPQNEVTHTLSPMAAAVLEDHMILNKRFNAGFHQLPGEWTEKKHHEQAQLQMIDPIEKRDTGTDKSKEIDQKLREKGSLSAEEAAKLLYYVTETFKLSTIDAAQIAASALEGK